MKKKLLLIILSLFPLNAYAYSNYVISGGDNIGIKLEMKGILIVGIYGKNINNINVGSYITKVNGINVDNINDLISMINKYQKDGIVNLTIDNKDIDFKLTKENNTYKTGLYVKDSITGIGTLTYIDPTTKIYGALGHEIVDSNTNKIVELDTGKIIESKVTDIDRSENGEPGSKNATISNDTIGTINKNTDVGIFGNIDEIKSNTLIEVGKPNDLKKGKAYIMTELDDNEVKMYEINITKLDNKHNIKNIYFDITDPVLLEKTGGIVQGMSGSPIIQNDKIYGAVTHVVINNVKKGYGVFITTMLEKGEK